MKFLGRLRHLLHRRQAEADLAEEIELHRAMTQERLQKAGMSAADATAGSRKTLGNVLAAREEAQEVWGTGRLHAVKQDLSYALRQVRRAPGLTSFIMLTLAIPIGAVTASTAIVNAEVFAYGGEHRLGESIVPNPHELKQLLWHTDFTPGFFAGNGRRYLSYPVYQHLRDGTSSFSDLVCLTVPYSEGIANAGAEEARVQFVSGNVFRALGISTVIGRPISPEDDDATAPPVAVVSHGFWQRVLGGSTDALGSVMAVNGFPVVVIGVLPERFAIDHVGSTPDLMIPVAHVTISGLTDQLGSAHSPCRILGRLRAGISEEGARAATEVLLGQALAQYPSNLQSLGNLRERPPQVGLRGVGRGIDETDFKDLREVLPAILSGISVLAIVLSITCTNIAGLLLARTVARHGEIATRLTLGASASRVFRQSMTESVLIAFAGGAAGILLFLVLRSIAMSEELPFAADYRVLLITPAFCAVTGILFGLVPAVHARRVDLLSLTKQAASGVVGRAGFRTGKVLVGVQVALAFPLLVCACVHTEILLALGSTGDLEPESVLKTLVRPRPDADVSKFSDSYTRTAVSSLEGLPGVLSASAMRRMDGARSPVCLAGVPPGDERLQTLQVVGVGPRFFETMKIPLLRGRDLEWEDIQAIPAVAVVNEEFVRRFFHDSNPLQQTIGLAGEAGCSDATRVVGVTPTWNDTVVASVVGTAVGPAVYLPLNPREPGVEFVTRTLGDATPAIPAVRQVLAEVDRARLADEPVTASQILAARLRQRRQFVAIFLGLGATALLQAVIGIYGTLAYFVNRRTSEIGLRMALGANRIDVIRMVVRQSLIPVVLGLLLGLSAVPLVTSLMFDELRTAMGTFTARNQLEIAAIVLLLFGTAFVAASRPAWTASRIDPMCALRVE